MKTYTLQLPYFKQGDDLNNYLEETDNNIAEAFELHSAQLESAADTLSMLAHIASENEMEIDADTHFISITCTDKVAELIRSEDIEIQEVTEDEDEKVDQYIS